MTSSIGLRPNSSCSWCKCPGNRPPAKHGWTRMSQTTLAVCAPCGPDRKFEDVVKSAQDAAVLVLVY